MTSIAQGQSGGALHTDAIEVAQFQVPYGILDGFHIDPGSGLNPTITKGRVFHPNGLTTVDDDAVGSVTDNQTTFLYLNIRTGSVEHKTSHAPSNPRDIYLGYITASGASITDVGPGQWLGGQVIKLTPSAVDVSGSPGDSEAAAPFAGPRPQYVHAVQAVAVTNTTGSPRVDFEVMAAQSGSKTALSDNLVIGALTADFSAWSGLATQLQSTPKLVRPGDRIHAKLGVAGTGTVDLYALVGGVSLES